MILEKAKPASSFVPQAEGYHIRALLAGPPGSGKTTSALSLPGRKLLIDCDRRAAAASGFENVSICEIVEPDSRSPRAWSECQKLYKELWVKSKDKDFYDTIIWDGITAMSRYAMNYALLLDSKRGLGGTPAQQHYMPQMKEMTDLIRGSLGLPCHVCFTCHLELIEDADDQSSKFLPKITGKLRTEIGSWFDETYLCQRHPGKGGKAVYSWLTTGTGKFDFLKSSLNQLGRYWTDPVELEPSLDGSKPWGFSELIERRFKKEEVKEEKVEKVASKIDYCITNNRLKSPSTTAFQNLKHKEKGKEIEKNGNI